MLQESVDALFDNEEEEDIVTLIKDPKFLSEMLKGKQGRSDKIYWVKESITLVDQ